MIVYITRDYEPLGGFYSAATTRMVDPFAEEIRRVDDFPDHLWAEGMAQGFPLDPDGTSDGFWFPYFQAGTPVWSR